MRAKFKINVVQNFTKPSGEIITQALSMSAVCADKFGENGESEDNDFQRWTPFGELNMNISNPDLIGVFNEGDKVYLDFTKAE